MESNNMTQYKDLTPAPRLDIKTLNIKTLDIK